MNILIAGGAGFIGRRLTHALTANGHKVCILSRREQTCQPAQDRITHLTWDGRTTSGWGESVNQMDAIINLVGKSLANWPWTSARKREFHRSRVEPGLALTEAIRSTSQRPKILIQASGINHYGFNGEPAVEETPAGDDFLAQLTVAWEDSTKDVEKLGVRRCIVRLAPVLGKGGGLLPLMALPAKFYLGGPLGNGKQATSWIHIDDACEAILYLLKDGNASGPFNLTSPEICTNEQFFRELTKSIKRPYWFRTPAFLLRWFLGDMSVLVLDGRGVLPQRIQELDFQFRYAKVRDAFQNLFSKTTG